jgi:hypothetical protein
MRQTGNPVQTMDGKNARFARETPPATAGSAAET